MESNDVERQLIEAERLAVATKVEASRTAVWATPAMTLALVVFFVLLSRLSDGARLWASAGWTLFVIAWVIAIRKGNRAMPRRRAATTEQRRRDLMEWALLFVLANVLTFAFSQVSWALVGVGLGCLGIGYGSLSAWRATRS